MFSTYLPEAHDVKARASFEMLGKRSTLLGLHTCSYWHLDGPSDPMGRILSTVDCIS